MGVFGFLKKNKVELSDEQKRWNRMWDLWVEGRAGSPYAELMTYQSEVNNGGHDQYFFNLENTGALQKELAALETILPEKLQRNLRDAYQAYGALPHNADEQAGALLDPYDDAFYESEEEINCILREYASGIE